MANFLEELHHKSKEAIIGGVEQGFGEEAAETVRQGAKKFEDVYETQGGLKAVKGQIKKYNREDVDPVLGGFQPSEGTQTVMTQQQDLIDELRRQAAGKGAPSAAQAQLQQATDANMRQSLAMAAGSRGNPALAMQAADRNRAATSQQAGAQSAALRAQEQQVMQSNLMQAIQNQAQTQYQQDALAAGVDQQAINAANAQNAQQRADRKGMENVVIEGAGQYFGMPPGTATAAAGQVNPPAYQGPQQGVNTPIQQGVNTQGPVVPISEAEAGALPPPPIAGQNPVPQAAPTNMALTAPQQQPMMMDPRMAQMMALQQQQFVDPRIAQMQAYNDPRRIV